MRARYRKQTCFCLFLFCFCLFLFCFVFALPCLNINHFIFLILILFQFAEKEEDMLEATLLKAAKISKKNEEVSLTENFDNRAQNTADVRCFF